MLPKGEEGYQTHIQEPKCPTYTPAGTLSRDCGISQIDATLAFKHTARRARGLLTLPGALGITAGPTP